ncbi:Bax inhibitor-1/YccA family protein [Rhodomicrobium sp. Az07]|uniref:Bax inhibitor-1/YccA family protein n=1 Tax=Rhodomicrobium sp. Az07 TaxID=2839034 RepID=UPI001BEC2040|nr:Bax inhibitor-1/YccA family protein [Rhodomicrobium sp. Az07]MBT3069503.1 Bax inhibitor-1/YccA family protein [Rhodomicrobium sp. Az07]
MADYDTSRAYNVNARARTDAFAIDEGLRAYMIRVFNYMGIGLVVTGIMAYTIYSLSVVTNDAGQITALTPLGQVIFKSWVKWLVMFAPLLVVFAFAASINRMSSTTAQGVFWLFAALMGLSLSSIFIAYTGNSIARIFFITAATFGAVSFWGYTTKRDLTKFGSFLIMGVIGLVIASVVNVFLGSSGMQFAISVLAVLIFTGLTAYDTQQLKDNYYAQAQGGEETLGRAAILGALSLYLNFINIFVALLSLFGDRRE